MVDPRRIALLEAEAGEYYETPITQEQFRLDLMMWELHYQVSILPKLQSFEAVRSHLKLYIITWCSLSDVLANLINHVYELGIAEKDTNLTMILRNTRIKKTGLGAIVQRHKRLIQFDLYTNKRNEIVHRGVLHEDELSSIFGRALSHAIQQTLGQPSKVDLRVLDGELQQLLWKKYSEFGAHMDATQTMLLEVMGELAKHVANRLR